jgi:hypothetical protein
MAFTGFLQTLRGLQIPIRVNYMAAGAMRAFQGDTQAVSRELLKMRREMLDARSEASNLGTVLQRSMATSRANVASLGLAAQRTRIDIRAMNQEAAFGAQGTALASRARIQGDSSWIAAARQHRMTEDLPFRQGVIRAQQESARIGRNLARGRLQEVESDLQNAGLTRAEMEATRSWQLARKAERGATATYRASGLAGRHLATERMLDPMRQEALGSRITGQQQAGIAAQEALRGRQWGQAAELQAQRDMIAARQATIDQGRSAATLMGGARGQVATGRYEMEQRQLQIAEGKLAAQEAASAASRTMMIGGGALLAGFGMQAILGKMEKRGEELELALGNLQARTGASAEAMQRYTQLLIKAENRTLFTTKEIADMALRVRNLAPGVSTDLIVGSMAPIAEMASVLQIRRKFAPEASNNLLGLMIGMGRPETPEQVRALTEMTFRQAFVSPLNPEQQRRAMGYFSAIPLTGGFDQRMAQLKEREEITTVMAGRGLITGRGAMSGARAFEDLLRVMFPSMQSEFAAEARGGGAHRGRAGLGVGSFFGTGGGQHGPMVASAERARLELVKELGLEKFAQEVKTGIQPEFMIRLLTTVQANLQAMTPERRQRALGSIPSTVSRRVIGSFAGEGAEPFSQELERIRSQSIPKLEFFINQELTMAVGARRQMESNIGTLMAVIGLKLTPGFTMFANAISHVTNFFSSHLSEGGPMSTALGALVKGASAAAGALIFFGGVAAGRGLGMMVGMPVLGAVAGGAATLPFTAALMAPLVEQIAYSLGLRDRIPEAPGASEAALAMAQTKEGRAGLLGGLFGEGKAGVPFGAGMPGGNGSGYNGVAGWFRGQGFKDLDGNAVKVNASMLQQYQDPTVQAVNGVRDEVRALRGDIKTPMGIPNLPTGENAPFFDAARARREQWQSPEQLRRTHEMEAKFAPLVDAGAFVAEKARKLWGTPGPTPLPPIQFTPLVPYSTPGPPPYRTPTPGEGQPPSARELRDQTVTLTLGTDHQSRIFAASEEHKNKDRGMLITTAVNARLRYRQKPGIRD